MTIVSEADTPSDVVDEIRSVFDRDQAALSNPFPIYRRLREEAPVVRVGPLVAVARYNEVREVLDAPDRFSSIRAVGSRIAARRERLDPEQQVKLDDLVDFESGWLAELDEPFHGELRGMVRYAFTPRQVNEMTDDIQALIDELLEPARATGQLDLIREFTHPLPLRVICQMLGAGADDAVRIREWSDALARAISTDYENVEEAHAAVEGFRALIGGYIKDRRDREDYSGLFGTIVSGNAGDGVLTDEQIVSMCVQLLFAGHETTTNLIGNAVVALLKHPDQMAVLREDPEKIKGAVEEFLRHDTSVHAIHRVAAEDTEIAGVPVNKGDTVRLLLASANRDDEMFTNPEDLDVTRENARRHLGMGFGIHSCLGIWLAKLETQLALRTLLADFTTIELRAGDPTIRPNFTLYGYEEVPLTVK